MKLIKKLSENFTVISNKILRCKELSNSAKGLYCILISLPDEWSFSAKGLSTMSSDGITSVSSSLKELEAIGLLKRIKKQNNKGHWIIEYHIFDEIIISDEFSINNNENTNNGDEKELNPIAENPKSENPISEMRQTYKIKNNQEINNKIKNNNNIKFDFRNELIKFGFEENLVDEWLLVRKKKRAVNTETAFNQFIDEVTKAGAAINEILRICVAHSWSGFKHTWDWRGESSYNDSSVISKVRNLK